MNINYIEKVKPIYNLLKIIIILSLFIIRLLYAKNIFQNKKKERKGTIMKTYNYIL